MENENDSEMATPIILPTLLSMNEKQRPLVSFVDPIVWEKGRSGSQMKPVISKGLVQEFANIKAKYNGTSHWDRMLQLFKQRLRQY